MSTRGPTRRAAKGQGRMGNRASVPAPLEEIAAPATPDGRPPIQQPPPATPDGRPPIQQPPPATIDVEAIEDDVQMLSPSTGFPQPRSRLRRNCPVMVVLDDEPEVNLREPGVIREEPVTILSVNTHKRHGRIPSNETVINCESYSNSVGSKRKSVGKSSPEPKKVAPKEPAFSCPICLNSLVNASSTICGHVFCQSCIRTSIQACKKCPICARKLTMNNFHRVYLPSTG